MYDRQLLSPKLHNDLRYILGQLVGRMVTGRAKIQSRLSEDDLPKDPIGISREHGLYQNVAFVH
jgi:hypothetical protein